MRCRCDGRYDGCEHGVSCDQLGGGHKSPFFCVDCDPRRIAQISADLAAIQRALDERS